MPNHASELEQKATRKQVYSRQYYLQHKDRYITNYERKREATFTCAPCHKVLKLVSKAAHEKTRKHLYAYYGVNTGACEATTTGSHRSTQQAEGESESDVPEEQGED